MRWGTRPDCKSCCKTLSVKRAQARNKLNPEKRKSTVLKNKYGITYDQYQIMLSSQGGVCKICNSASPGPKSYFAVDHNHETGKVRGLLCYLCNMGLGSFRDKTDLLRSAIEYLRETNV